jgi:hypothetical protein
MDKQHKFALHRRSFLNGLIAATGALATGASAGTESDGDKRHSRYRVADEVKTYYRVNNYPT